MRTRKTRSNKAIKRNLDRSPYVTEERGPGSKRMPTRFADYEKGKKNFENGSRKPLYRKHRRRNIELTKERGYCAENRFAMARFIVKTF